MSDTDVKPSTATFDQFGLAPDILKAIQEQGYTTPTPIQAQAIPVVLTGRDVMGAAQTGTGKTASFSLPILQRLLPMASTSASPARHPVRALILTPTRELADQVANNVRTYAQHTALRSAVVFTSSRRPRIWARCRCSCSTKPTACWTWASCRICSAS
jgi:ATP-dependent RNA helicase RhlE